jgi:hypothetical protein
MHRRSEESKPITERCKRTTIALPPVQAFDQNAVHPNATGRGRGRGPVRGRGDFDRGRGSRADSSSPGDPEMQKAGQNLRPVPDPIPTSDPSIPTSGAPVHTEEEPAPGKVVKRVEEGQQSLGEAPTSLDVQNHPKGPTQSESQKEARTKEAQSKEAQSKTEPGDAQRSAPSEERPRVEALQAESREGRKGSPRNQKPEKGNAQQRAQTQVASVQPREARVQKHSADQPSAPQQSPKPLEAPSNHASHVNAPPMHPQHQPPLLALPVHTPTQKGILPDPISARQVPRSPNQPTPAYTQETRPSESSGQRPNQPSVRNKQPRQAPRLTDLAAASSQGIERGPHGPPSEQPKQPSSQDARKEAGEGVRKSPRPQTTAGTLPAPPQNQRRGEPPRLAVQPPPAQGPPSPDQQRLQERGLVPSGWGEIPTQGPSGWVIPSENTRVAPGRLMDQEPRTLAHPEPPNPQRRSPQNHAPEPPPNAAVQHGAGWVVPMSTQPRRNERGPNSGPPVPTGWPGQPRPNLISADLNPPRGPVPPRAYAPMGFVPQGGGFTGPPPADHMQMGFIPPPPQHQENRPLSREGQQPPRGHSQQKGPGQRGSAQAREVVGENRPDQAPRGTGWGLQTESQPALNQRGNPTGWDVLPPPESQKGPGQEGSVRPEGVRPHQDVRKLQQGPEAAAEAHGEGGSRERRRDGRRDGQGSRGARGAVKSENSEDAAGMWNLCRLGRRDCILVDAPKASLLVFRMFYILMSREVRRLTKMGNPEDAAGKFFLVT